MPLIFPQLLHLAKSQLCRLIGLFLVLSLNQMAIAQDQQNIDSLQRIVETTTNDTDHVHALLRISAQYAFLDTTLQRTFHDKALVAAQQTGNHYLIGRVYTSMATREKDLGRPAMAQKYALLALEEASRLDEVDYLPVIYLNLGQIASQFGKSRQSIGYQLQALQLSRDMGRPNFERYALSGIGIAYEELGKEDSSIYYFTEVTRLSEKSGNLHHIANSYLLLADSYRKYKRNRNAIDYGHKALAAVYLIRGKGGVAPSLVQGHNILSTSYYSQNMFDSALFHADSAIWYSLAIGNQLSESRSRLNRAYALRSPEQRQRSAKRVEGHDQLPC